MGTVEGVIWYLFVLDSVGANIAAWFFANWAEKNFKGILKHIPLKKSWAAIYLLLVLWVGYGLLRLGII